MNDNSHQNPVIPSRQTNPFASCWTRPGTIPFQFPADVSPEILLNDLAAANWWGEIVGAHGSGKSTLLESLKPWLVAAGRSVSAFTLRDGERRLPPDFLRTACTAPRPLVIIDGYEQLSMIYRLYLRNCCRRASAGLLITSHVRVGLPLLFHTQPNFALATLLVSNLTAHISSPIGIADIAASHACHGSNVRELLFALYDRHERLVRTTTIAG